MAASAEAPISSARSLALGGYNGECPCRTVHSVPRARRPSRAAPAGFGILEIHRPPMGSTLSRTLRRMKFASNSPTEHHEPAEGLTLQ